MDEGFVVLVGEVPDLECEVVWEEGVAWVLLDECDGLVTWVDFDCDALPPDPDEECVPVE